jgi:hypothetical protein
MLSRTLFQGLMVGALTLAGGASALAPQVAAQARLVVERDSYDPPPRIETYPRTRYEDRDVYYANRRWYYRHGPRWQYYHREPARLRRHRVEVIERPRHHRRHVVYRDRPRRERNHVVVIR